MRRGDRFNGLRKYVNLKLWYFKNAQVAAVAWSMGSGWWSRSNSTISVMGLYIIERLYCSYQNSTSKLQACGGLSVSAAVPVCTVYDAENKL